MCRSDTFSYTVPARRSTEPEVFTFDRIPEVPAQAAQCARPAQPPRRRVVRVLYPSTGRRYLPPAERSPAKRWLLALCLVVLLQIYAEDDVTAGPEEVVAGGKSAFASAEEEMKAALAATVAAEGATCTRDSSWLMHEKQEKTCPERWSVQRVHEEDSASARARARNGGYVVALLYPVYHKLGSEQ